MWMGDGDGQTGPHGGLGQFTSFILVHKSIKVGTAIERH
jgi:hypothetical protein